MVPRENNHQNPLVSVVMPFYNSQRFLAASIESILNQNYTNWELILVDDASTDTSGSIAAAYAAKDHRIKLIHCPSNRFPESRNIGLKAARGKYYAVNDSDDISRSDRLQKQVDYLEVNRDYAMIGSDIAIIDENGAMIGNRQYPSSYQDIVKQAIKVCPFAHSTVLMRIEVIREFNGYTDLFITSDYELWLKILLQYPAYNLNESLVQYRLSRNQIKSRVRQAVLQTLKTQRKYLFRNPYFSLSGLFFHICQYGLILLPEKFVMLLYRKFLISSGHTTPG